METREGTYFREVITDLQDAICNTMSTINQQNEGLRKQLVEIEVAELQKELASKEKNISELRIKIESSSRQILNLEKQGNRKDEEIRHLSEAIRNLTTNNNGKATAQQATDHNECKMNQKDLEKRLCDAHSQTSKLQDQLIQSNAQIITQQQQMTANHLDANERLLAINNTLHDTVKSNAVRWSDIVAGRAANAPPTNPSPQNMNAQAVQPQQVQKPRLDSSKRQTTTNQTQASLPPERTSIRKATVNASSSNSTAGEPTSDSAEHQATKNQAQALLSPDSTPSRNDFKNAAHPGSTRIKYFKGAQNNLSNLAPCNLKYKGRQYINVEQAYYHRLLTEHEETELANTVLELLSPNDIKTVGEAITVSNKWEIRKIEVMKEIVKEKFKDPGLREELKNTFPCELRHNVTNTLWGMGANNNGRNTLGQILMELRGELRGQPASEGRLHRTETTQSSNPKVLLVGDSQLRKFQPDRIKGVNFSLEMRTINEASQELGEKNTLPTTVILHLLTESLRKESVSEATSKIKVLAQKLEQRHKTRVLVSLGLPVEDHNLNKRIKAANILLKADQEIVTICHTASFTTKGYPNEYLYEDGMHPNVGGLRRLAVNFKAAVLQPQTAS